MKEKDITVLICIHSNSESYDQLFRRALKSLIKQSFQSFKVLIIKDSSWHQTDLVINDFRSILDIYDFKHQKAGLAKAKNFGLQYCDTDWIMYLDADDSLEPTKIEEQIDFIQENPQYDIVGTLAWDTYNPGTDQEYKRPSCFAEGQYDEDWKIRGRLMQENVFTHGSLAIRKSLLDKIGGYPENKSFVGMEDWVMLQNAIYNYGAKAFIMPRRLYNYSMNTSVAR